MTGMVTVRLILYGLIAFVPNSNDSPTTINALLVDARGPQYASDGCKIPSHNPVLYAKAGGCRVNGRACTVSDQVERPTDVLSGAWRLNRESLSIEVLPAGKKTHARKLVLVHEGKMNTSSFPSSPEQGVSLNWIPEMRNFMAAPSPDGKDGMARVDRGCLGKADECPIVARVALNDGRVTSCHLAAIRETGMVYPFEFKPLDPNVKPLDSTAKPMMQAMSDAVMVTFQVPRGSKVEIKSRELKTEVCSKPQKTIVLEDKGRETIDIWITNVPSYYQCTMQSNSCNHMSMDVDPHFELYYNLTADPVPYSQRVVPHRVQTQGQLGVRVQPKDNEYCPPLIFKETACSSADRDDGRVPYDWKSCGNVWLSAPHP